MEPTEDDMRSLRSDPTPSWDSLTHYSFSAKTWHSDTVTGACWQGSAERLARWRDNTARVFRDLASYKPEGTQVIVNSVLRIHRDCKTLVMKDRTPLPTDIAFWKTQTHFYVEKRKEIERNRGIPVFSGLPRVPDLASEKVKAWLLKLPGSPAVNAGASERIPSAPFRSTSDVTDEFHEDCIPHITLRGIEMSHVADESDDNWTPLKFEKRKLPRVTLRNRILQQRKLELNGNPTAEEERPQGYSSTPTKTPQSLVGGRGPTESETTTKAEGKFRRSRLLNPRQPLRRSARIKAQKQKTQCET